MMQGLANVKSNCFSFI